MILVIGEILLDIFPQYKRIGGAPFNFAFHLKNLGIPVCFVTRIGNDTDGEEISRYLKQHGFSMTHVQIDEARPTGKVLIELDNKGIPEFKIIQDVAYDYITLNNSIRSMLEEKIDLIYTGSLIQRSDHGFNTMREILAGKDEKTLCLYDVNLRPRCYTNKVITETIKHSDIIKLNDDELGVIRRIFDFRKNNNAFIEFLMSEYSPDMLSVTKGDRGSDLFTKDGRFSIQPAKINRIIDTVGAGDAYAAMLAVGRLKNLKPEKIIKIAAEFSSAICEIKGAIPSDIEFYGNIKKLIIEDNNEER